MGMTLEQYLALGGHEEHYHVLLKGGYELSRALAEQIAGGVRRDIADPNDAVPKPQYVQLLALAFNVVYASEADDAEGHTFPRAVHRALVTAYLLGEAASADVPPAFLD